MSVSVASDDSSYMTVLYSHVLEARIFFSDKNRHSAFQGTDFKVEGGLTSCYVTPLGEPALAPPESLTSLI